MRTHLLPAALLLLALAAPAKAGWGAGGCGAPAVQLAPMRTPALQGWHDGTTADGKPCSYWYYQGQVTAGYDAARGVYRDYSAGQWSAPRTPPWQWVKAACACGGDYHRCTCDPKTCACPGCLRVFP